MSPISETESLEALNQIAAANREMAERVRAPGWYSWSLSLMMGGLAAVQEFPLPVIFGYEIAFFVALFFLIRAYKRKSGIWIPGYRAGRTRWVASGGGSLTPQIDDFYEARGRGRESSSNLHFLSALPAALSLMLCIMLLLHTAAVIGVPAVWLDACRPLGSLSWWGTA